MSKTLTQDEQKALAAKTTVDHLLSQLGTKSPVLLGIGSGSTIVHAVKYLDGILTSQQSQTKFICVPTSFQAKQLIQESKNLILGGLEQYPELDFALDGADEVDRDLNLIKGGGGCLTQEKIVAFAAQQFYVICDASKDSPVLGRNWTKGVPVEVIPMSYTMVEIHLKEKLAATKVELRMAKSKAGPVVTDNGMFILDVVFPEKDMKETEKLEQGILNIPGVVCTGLFNRMANKVFFAFESGDTKIVQL
eukprot:augustus_masked-scaffold_56-processed-gene-1.99-mRNA-1 protein AED:0.13 eAED:0.13 QI:0/-1/0/1/-1/1/1/0/248